MKNSPKLIVALTSGAAVLVGTTLSAATTAVVGYTSTTLPAGTGSLYAPSFVNSDSFNGTLAGVSASTLTLSASVSANAFDESTSVESVSKGYPLYYVEVLNDTASDGFDTEGLVIDIVSNTATGVVVGADAAALGVQGDEQIAIRKHLTLGDVFAGATGITSFTDTFTVYNEDGPGTAVTHISDGVGGFLLNTDFTTSSTDAPIYPGTGLAIGNVGPITIIPTGVVKETDTQVAVYGGSVVNIIGVLKPLTSVDLAADGRLNDALGDFTDVVTPYTQGTLAPVTLAGVSPGFLDDGAGGFLSADFTTPVNPSVDGTHEAVAVSAGSNTVVKLSGTVIP